VLTFDAGEVHLATSTDHLNRLYIVLPAGTAFAEARIIPSDVIE
jgi:hypothetical protein